MTRTGELLLGGGALLALVAASSSRGGRTASETHLAARHAQAPAPEALHIELK